MTIQDQIKNIVATAEKSQATLMSGKGFEAFCEEQKKLDAKMDHFRKVVKDMAKTAGMSLIVGSELNFGVADGMATYYVTKIRKNDVVVVHVPHGDAYHFAGVYQNGKGELCLPRQVAETYSRF